MAAHSHLVGCAGAAVMAAHSHLVGCAVAAETGPPRRRPATVSCRSDPPALIPGSARDLRRIHDPRVSAAPLDVGLRGAHDLARDVAEAGVSWFVEPCNLEQTSTTCAAGSTTGHREYE